MRNQSIRGIVLRKRNIGENDQIVTIYSPPLGKFEASAKGARKINSHFGGHLETLNICDFTVYTNGNNHTLTQCQCINSFKFLKNDLHLSVCTFIISEIFYRMTPSDGHGDDFFLLLLETISSLEKGRHELIMDSFKIKLLNAAGSLPEISECGECRHKWTEDDSIFMDPDGHLTCLQCSPYPGQKEEISFNIIKLLNYITTASYPQIQKINLSERERLQLKKISDILLHSYINLELKSEKIAGQILI